LSESHYFRLMHAEARRRAIEAIQQSPEGYQVKISEPTRKEAQSAKFHALCGDVSKQALFGGKKRSKDAWKIIFVSAHAVATGQGSEVMPGLEGEWINLRESTASMGVKRMSSLIEYVLAWGSEHGVKWSEPA
jgi:NinB protein